MLRKDRFGAVIPLLVYGISWYASHENDIAFAVKKFDQPFGRAGTSPGLINTDMGRDTRLAHF